MSEPTKGIIFVLILVPLILAIAIIAIAWAGPAGAHSFYSPRCCRGTDVGGDCHPVSCGALEDQSDGGYLYTAPNGRKTSFTADEVHPSEDAQCHVCIGAETSENPWPHCVYILLGY